MSPNLIKFVQFFNIHVTPQYFLMSESPVLWSTMNNPCYGGQPGGDLVSWMRMFVHDGEFMSSDYIDPCSAFDMEAKLYYNLVLGRGRWANRCYKLNLKRFDRFPDDMRKEIALDVLLRVIVGDGAPWYEAVRNRAGLNATGAVVEWCSAP